MGAESSLTAAELRSLGDAYYNANRYEEAADAERIFKRLLLGHPLASEAQIARAKLTAMGAESSLTAAELRSLGDAYYNAGRYEEAAEQYRALARSPGLDRDAKIVS